MEILSQSQIDALLKNLLSDTSILPENSPPSVNEKKMPAAAASVPPVPSRAEFLARIAAGRNNS